MKKFKVIIPCTVYHTYEVEAESEEEALFRWVEDGQLVNVLAERTGAEPIHTEYTGDGLGAIVEEIK